MAARRKAEQPPNESAQSQTPAPLPAPGIGPLAKYPVPAGATHWRVHEIGTDGRIRDAMSLVNDDQGQPVTRYPIATVGDAGWWDSFRTGQQVRLVFTRYHGDQLKARLGQGPIWTVPSGGERVDARPPAAPAAPSQDGSLFIILRQMHNEAHAQAQLAADRHTAALQAMLLSQAENQRAFYQSMTQMFVGERGAERAGLAKERQAERAAELARVEALRTVVRDELAAASAAAADDDEDETPDAGDAIATALSGLGDTLKPLTTELGKRAARAAAGG